jgi:hypothetical protein
MAQDSGVPPILNFEGTSIKKQQTAEHFAGLAG